MIQNKETNEYANNPWMTIVCSENLHINQIINYDETLLWQLPPEQLIGKHVEEFYCLVSEANRKDTRIFTDNCKKFYVTKKKSLFKYKSELEDKSVFYASCYTIYESPQKAILHIMPIDKEDYGEDSPNKIRETQFAFKTASIKFWTFNTQTRCVTILDDPFCEHGLILNLSIDECLDFIHPDDRKKINYLIEEMIKGKTTNIDIDAKTKSYSDGEWKNFVYVGSLSEKNEELKAYKYVGLYKDNTALYKKWGLTRTILDYIPIPIYIKDIANGNQYIFQNKESEKLFGNSTFSSISGNGNKEQSDATNNVDQYVFETGEPFFGQEKIVMPDGRQFETIVHKSVIYEEDKRYLLVVRWDISEREELLRRSKALSISMNALNAFTWYYDSRDGKLVFGDGFEKTKGDRIALNSMINYAKSIHPEDKEEYISFISKFMEQDKGEFAIEYRIDFAGNGNYEWWECRGVMETIKKDNNQYKYIYGMDINIDAHKYAELTLLKNKSELAQLNKQNELVLNNINSGLAYINADFTVQWENISISSFKSPFGNYEKGRLCYESARKRTSPCENCIMQKALQSKQVEQVEVDYPDNQTIHILATPVLKENGDTEGVVLRIDDISERKQMIRDLQKAKAEAEQSDKLKSAFVANMSHEIRTPLNSIVGFSELLMDAVEPEEKEEYKKIISSNNELLLKLINDILDLSKIEAGFVEIKPQQFDLAEYFDEIALSFQYRIGKPNVKYIINNPYQNCLVELDKNRIAQILTNYITNAIKYTADGCIEVGYEFKEGNIKLYVKDSGIGIPEHKKHKVFQRFEKLDEFAQGTGLGLSICKAISEAFKGTVGFESEENKGSTFWASIPCGAQVTSK